jgi:peptidyl-prolyl cis-trans isomerase C
MHDRAGPVPVSSHTKIIGALIVGATLAFAPLTAAQETSTTDVPAAVTPDTVVATVGGQTITEADVAFAAEEMQQELSQMPLEARKAFLVSMLIDMKIMATAAREAQMDQTELFARRLQYLEERALNRVFFAEKVAAAVTMEAIQAAYDAYVANYGEVHVKHILLSTEEDALAVKAELGAGASFETLAMEKSIDPSAKQNGGDLDFVPRGRTVKPFEDAAFALTTPGQLSDPVQTQFGWHIIRFEEARKGTPLPFEQKAAELQQQLLVESFDTAVSSLKAATEVSIADPALAEAVAAQNEPSAN